MKNKLIRPKTILHGALATIILLIVLLATLRPKEKQSPETKAAALPVSTLRVQRTNTVDIAYLPAIIEANVSAVLSAEKAGRIAELMADRGDEIEKTQQLLQIDDRIWQANLKQAEITARDAEKNFERFSALQKTGAVSASEYDRIEKEHVTAMSLLAQANISIEQCRVESPIDGIVNDRFVEEGEYVQAGDPLFQVVDHATVKVLIQVPEKDIYAIVKGDEINFTVQPLPNRIFTGKVGFVAVQADNRNNAFTAELEVDNADGTLRPGMIAQVEFQRGINEDMVALPMSSVLPSKGDHIVYLVKDGHAVRRKVQIENITRERALISSGLEDGDLVVVEGSRTLHDGQLVEPVKTEATR